MMEKREYITPGKKGPREYGTGALYRNKNGLWVGRLTLDPGPDGKRRRSKPVYSKDRSKALEKLKKLRDLIDQGIDEVDTSTTLEAWLTHWLETIKKPNLSPKTMSGYRSTVNLHLVPHIGTKKVGKLTPADVRRMLAEIAKDPALAGSRSAVLAHMRLCQALDDAMKEDPPLALRNVAKLVAKPKYSADEGEAHTAEEARKVLLNAIESKDAMATRWAMGYMTAQRQGEVLGLEIDRIDFERMHIDVSWQLQSVKLKPGAKRADPDRYDAPPGFELRPLVGALALVRPKSDSRRIIPMPGPLAEILERYLEQQEPNEYGLVWVNAQGRPIQPSADTKAWKAALARAGVRGITGHEMRHTCNSLLAEMGVPADIRMEILGQSTMTAQRIYTHLSLDAARKALGNLDGLLELPNGG